MAPVNFMFNRQGCIRVALDKSTGTFGELMDVALENGATDYDEALKLQGSDTAYFWVSYVICESCYSSSRIFSSHSFTATHRT